MRLRKKTRERLFIASFLAGPLAVYLVFVIWPYVETFGYSLTEWSGVAPPSKVVGLKNYADLFHDSIFLKALGHNMIILIVFPTVTIVLAMFFAFMLNVGGRRGGLGGVRGIGGSAFFRIVFFFPQVLSVAIIVILFQAAYESNSVGPVQRHRHQARPDRREPPVGVPELPDVRALVHHVHPGLAVGRLLPGAVLRGHAADPRATTTRRRCWTAPAAPRPTSRSRCPCCGTRCRPPGCTWRSPRWTPSPWSPP